MAYTTRKTLSDTLGREAPATTYPYGPEFFKVPPYKPYYNSVAARTPGPEDYGTQRKSLCYKTATPAPPAPQFKEDLPLYFEFRPHSARNLTTPADRHVALKLGNRRTVGTKHSLGHLLQAALSQAYHGLGLESTQQLSNRIEGVYGPSGKKLNTGFGYTMYDQSPPILAGSTLVVVYHDY